MAIPIGSVLTPPAPPQGNPVLPSYVDAETQVQVLGHLGASDLLAQWVHDFQQLAQPIVAANEALSAYVPPPASLPPSLTSHVVRAKAHNNQCYLLSFGHLTTFSRDLISWT